MRTRLCFVILLLAGLSSSLWAQNTAPENQSISTAASASASDQSAPLAAAWTLFRQGKYDQSATAFQAVIDADSHNGSAYAGLIRSLLRTHKSEEADLVARRVLHEAANDSAARTAAADVDMRFNRFLEAQTGYLRAMQLDDSNARARLGLGRLARATSNRNMAYRYIERAYELDPNDPDILVTWMYQNPDPSKKVELMEKYIKLLDSPSPEHVEGMRRYIEFLKEYGDHEATLESPYQHYSLPLEKMFYKPGVIRGWGMQIVINGNKPVRFMLDTGASGLTIGKKLADKLGIKLTAHGSEMYGIGDQGAVATTFGIADKVEVGGVKFANVLIDVSSKNAILDDVGLIGSDVFRDFQLTLDLSADSLDLDPFPNYDLKAKDRFRTDRKIPPGWEHATQVFMHGHSILVPTVLGTKPDAPKLFFILDTGASENLISISAAKRVTHVGGSDDELRGISGKVKNVYNARKATLIFGGYKQENREITAIDLNERSDDAGIEIGGFLGKDLLARFRLRIDYRDGLVEFTYVEHNSVHPNIPGAPSHY
jgi:tetratricopeptide (TPR) repeat protein